MHVWALNTAHVHSCRINLTLIPHSNFQSLGTSMCNFYVQCRSFVLIKQIIEFVMSCTINTLLVRNNSTTHLFVVSYIWWWLLKTVVLRKCSLNLMHVKRTVHMIKTVLLQVCFKKILIFWRITSNNHSTYSIVSNDVRIEFELTSFISNCCAIACSCDPDISLIQSVVCGISIRRAANYVAW